MTIRKLWLLVLVVVVTISVGINALVLTSLMDTYFEGYVTESYELNVNQIIDYAKKTLKEENVSFNQMEIELETHLDDPITRIKLYNLNGELLVDVHTSTLMMRGKMMSEMMNSVQEQVEQYTLIDSGVILGTVNITTNSSAENSLIAHVFKATLLSNSFKSILIAMAISIVIGIIVSKKMSTALKDTAELAQDIQIGKNKSYKKTGIREINTVRNSLDALSTRLKLKQKSRKTLIDELVHQTRTPLTVLKSHLEALEDGIIEVTSEEINICQNQIENITGIISNMSGMIDANKDILTLKNEEFEFSQLIKQVVGGLKTQFDKKGIILELSSKIKVEMNTDKYKLSQVIYNILTNAYKYTNQGGQVSVSYSVVNDMLKLKIKDTGIGIEQEELDKIFQAYYRSNDVPNSKGEGIGLFIVKENLNLINGSIEVISQKNVGSSFIIKVPIKYDMTL